MRTCVILFSKDIWCSLLINDRLVISRSFKDVEEIPNFINKIGIEKLSLVYQGTPVPTKTTDSFKIGDVALHGRITPLVVRDRDVSYFTDMATFLKIPNVTVNNYLDYMKSKYSKDSNIIIVDSYLKDYCVVYLEYGEIKDFTKSSRTNLSRTISRYKTEYKCPVMSIGDRIDLIGLKSTIVNISELPKKQQEKGNLARFEYLAYFCEHDGDPLIDSNGSIASVSEWIEGDEKSPANGGCLRSDSDEQKDNEFEETDDELPEINKKLPRREKKPKKSRENTRGRHLDLNSLNEKEENNKFLDTCINVGFVILLCIFIAGIVLCVVYRGKVDLARKQLDNVKLQEVNSKSSEAYLKGDSAKSPMMKTLKLYQLTGDLKINNYLYENGESSVIALSSDQDSVKQNEKIISSMFNITGKSFMGKYKDKDKTYDKTKYIIGDRNG